MDVKFTWNKAKNEKNFRKHGVWFEEAATAFSDINSCEVLDRLNLVLEERYVLTGLSSRLRILTVVYCEREGFVRVISARKAVNSEVITYEKRIRF